MAEAVPHQRITHGKGLTRGPEPARLNGRSVPGPPARQHAKNAVAPWELHAAPPNMSASTDGQNQGFSNSNWNSERLLKQTAKPAQSHFPMIDDTYRRVTVGAHDSFLMRDFVFSALIDGNFYMQARISRTKEFNEVVCESGTKEKVAPW